MIVMLCASATGYYIDARAGITGIDATVLMKANLPPPERRGLVLIDPPYEVKNERELALDALRFGIRRFATGIFMIWYPVKGEDFAEQICTAFQNLGIPAMLKAELRVRESFTGGGLAGSGLIIVNPPWGLEAELKMIVPALAARLGIGTWGQGWWLVPPKT
jgi:23S rRNA (adenine2030-N6)-methyltransferase